MSELRSLVRQLLLEELTKVGAINQTKSNQEVVSIGSDVELRNFILRILELAEDSTNIAKLRSGEISFLLSNGSDHPMASKNAGDKYDDAQTPEVQFSAGLVTEKDIVNLSNNTSSITIGKSVCFPPLAKDEIRRKGIHIVRKTQ